MDTRIQSIPYLYVFIEFKRLFYTFRYEQIYRATGAAEGKTIGVTGGLSGFTNSSSYTEEK